MGLEYLLRIPWHVQSEGFVRDFEEGARQKKRFKYTVRAKPDQWTWDFIGRAFQCPSQGHPGFSQRHSLCVSYFEGSINSSHGWRISSCKDEEFEAILRFLNPIFRLGKPHYCTTSLANTILMSWQQEYKVNWACFFAEVLSEQLRTLQSGRWTSLPSYLA